MNTLTYKEAYNKIIDAYFKDEIKPMDYQFCFCGTLSPDKNWNRQISFLVEYPYTIDEYLKMEAALFNALDGEENEDTWDEMGYEKYEQYLFKGMCAALEVLKDIHKSRGENVEEEFEFKKRQLAI